MLNVYIGYDTRDDSAYQVARHSLLKRATIPVRVVPLRQDWLRRIGLYRRAFYIDDGQQYDAQDGRPFSTEFAFTRFLVPSLQPDGWALFCDSDFLFRADVADLARLFDARYAAMCVQHDYQPVEETKMRGQIQAPYARKNWTSLIAWNCSHRGARTLTPYQANTMSGRWLHQLTWLEDKQIGALPAAWNWLDGHSPEDVDAYAAHFTRGTPDMDGWKETRYAGEWWAALEETKHG